MRSVRANLRTLIMCETERLQTDDEGERPLSMEAEAGVQGIVQQLKTTQATAQGRSRFVARLGHALRTPLNPILAFSEVLLEESSGPLNDRQRAQLGRIRDAGSRLLDLVNSLTELARLQAGEETLQASACDVAQLVDRVVAEFHVAAREKDVALSTDVGADRCALTTDPRWVERVVRLLMSNAIKFSEAAGSVVVTVRPLQRGPNGGPDVRPRRRGVQLTVADTGIGMSANDRSRLLSDCEPPPGPDQPKRTGVGLPLVGRIVDLLEGHVSVESDGVSGHGTQFIVDLPDLSAESRGSGGHPECTEPLITFERNAG